MKNQFPFNLQRGLILIALGLSLASFNALAITKAKPASSTASTNAPVAKQAAPSLAKAPPATAPGTMSEDIRDIRGPKHIPSPWLWTLWLARGAALAALLYAAWLWSRRRAIVAAKLPYEIALARLEEARALMQPENAREFSIVVSEIVRGYIEERFQVWAARRTTEEFLHDLLEPSDALLTNHRALLAEFLHHCDLAKFARWILSLDEMETMHRSACAFVLETGRPPEIEVMGTPSGGATDTLKRSLTKSAKIHLDSPPPEPVVASNSDAHTQTLNPSTS
jgi:hypothetical protein